MDKTNQPVSSDVPDAVVTVINCALTRAKKKSTLPCKVMCSYSKGIVTFAVEKTGIHLAVRLDEMFAIFKAAAQQKAYTDAELEEKWRELQTVPWGEGDSPSGMILADPWWIFPKGVDRDELRQWFGERHSRGLELLTDRLCDLCRFDDECRINYSGEHCDAVIEESIARRAARDAEEVSQC